MLFLDRRLCVALRSHKGRWRDESGVRNFCRIPKTGITAKMVARHCHGGRQRAMMKPVRFSHISVLPDSEIVMADAKPSNSFSWGDALFLYIERPGQPLSIACVSVFEGAISVKAVRELVESKLPQIPRYTQQVAFPPFNIGLPTWQTDPKFDIRNHIRQVTLRGGTESRSQGAHVGDHQYPPGTRQATVGPDHGAGAEGQSHRHDCPHSSLPCRRHSRSWNHECPDGPESGGSAARRDGIRKPLRHQSAMPARNCCMAS